MTDRSVSCLCAVAAWMAGLLLASCAPSADPRATAAERVLRDTAGQDPQFAIYALDVASRSVSPVTEQFIAEQLSSDDFEVLQAAAEAAARRPSGAFAAALQQIFESRHGPTKLHAAGALAGLGDADAVAWLKQQAAAGSGLPNPSTVRFLKAAGEVEVLKSVLAAALQSEQQEERDAVYAMLGEIEESWSTEMVLKGLKKEFGEGRRGAIEALGRVGQAEHSAEIRRFINTKGLVFATIEALGRLGDEKSVAALQPLLTHGEQIVRVYAAAALSKLGHGQQAQAAIDEALGSAEWRTRLALAEQLADAESERALSILATLAGDGEPRVRVAAVRALRDKENPGLETILLERISDTEYEVSSVALNAVGSVAGAEALESVEPLLSSENGYVALSAACAMLDILARQAPGA